MLQVRPSLRLHWDDIGVTKSRSYWQWTLCTFFNISARDTVNRSLFMVIVAPDTYKVSSLANRECQESNALQYLLFAAGELNDHALSSSSKPCIKAERRLSRVQPTSCPVFTRQIIGCNSVPSTFDFRPFMPRFYLCAWAWIRTLGMILFSTERW